MFIKRFSLLFSSFVLVLFIGCFIDLDPISASALDGGRFLTPAESLEIFGSEISVKYYNGNDYVDAVARYQGVDSVREIYWTDDTSYLVAGRQLLRYSFSASGISNNPDYITVDLSPQYSIFDTSMIYTSIGVTAPQQSIDVYQSPQWEWSIAGNRVLFEAGSIADSQGLLQRYRLQSNNLHYICFVPAYYTAQNTFSAYSLRATFSGAATFSGQVEVLISVPYISSDASGSSGVVTTSSASSGGGDINVNVDMSETNSLLDSLVSGINGLGQFILDGLVSLFVPSDDFFDSLIDQLRQRFSWYTSIEDAFDSLLAAFSSSNFDSPPTVFVDGDNRSFFGAHIGTFSAPALVFDWFSAHRAAARTVISSFMWVFFLLRIYKHLPSIIAGNSSGSDGGDDA